jgi:cell division control protein 12
MVCIPLPAGIGILSIPNQYHQRALQRGIDYNILLVGLSGLGKRTFIDSLLSVPTCQKMHLLKPENHSAKTICFIQEHYANIVESEFCTSLCLAEAVGFGEAVDNSDCWVPIVQYVEQKNDEFWQSQISPNGPSGQRDGRVHVVLYFISPHGNGLKPLDLLALKHIAAVCNVVPVIGKADLLSVGELARLKGQVRECLRHSGICTFDRLCEGFTSTEKASNSLDQDEEWASRTAEIFSAFPLAVIGGNLEEAGEKLTRTLPWGTIQVDNEEHCDFKKARSLLFRVNMIDLLEATQRLHYERFRSNKLLQQANVPLRSVAAVPSNDAATGKGEVEAYAAKEEARIVEKERAIRELKARLEREIEVEHFAVSQLKEKLVAFQKKSHPVAASFTAVQ